MRQTIRSLFGGLCFALFMLTGFFPASSASALVVGTGGGLANSTVRHLFFESGAHSAREATNWNLIETSRGVYNWNVQGKDTVINDLASRGVSVIWGLWYQNVGLYGSITSDLGRQGYANYAKAAAQHFGNKVKYYEVWNEWNGMYGPSRVWNKPPNNVPAEYVKLLCAAYPAIKSGNPNAIVVGGATANVHTSWISGMLDAGAGNCMDMISVHPYVYGGGRAASVTLPLSTSVDVASDEFIKQLVDLENLIKQKTGKTIPILVTEDGVGANSNPQYAQKIADYLTQIYTKSKAHSFIHGIWWFAFSSLAEFGVPKFTGWDMVTPSGQKRPAFFAFQSIAKGIPNTGSGPGVFLFASPLPCFSGKQRQSLLVEIQDHFLLRLMDD